MIFRKSKEEQLMEAIKKKDKIKVSQLIQKGVNLDYRQQGKAGSISPLESAVAFQEAELVDLLLNKGADVNNSTRNGYTALFIAVINLVSDPKIIGNLIGHGADVNAKSSVEGWTPLLYATKKIFLSEPVVIRQLIDAGANINDHNVFGETPLMYAAAFASDEVVKYLLEKGADTRLINNDGESALHFATKLNDEGYLESAKASWNESMQMLGGAVTFYEEGKPVFDNYLKENRQVRPKVVRLLLEYDADINAATAVGLTPLQYAISAHNFDIVNLLIQRGATLDIGDETPLMTAVWCNQIDTVKLMIEKGADVNHTKATGENALEWAIFHGNDDLAKLLLNAGAQKNFSRGFRELASNNEKIALTLKRLQLTM